MTDIECDQLIDFIENSGFYAKYREGVEEYPTSVICAMSEPSKGKSVLSFWTTRIRGTWYIASWGYRYWRVPPNFPISEVCLAYLRESGSSVGAPAPSVLDAFELEEVDLEELKNLKQ